jgi:hypothetical protein
MANFGLTELRLVAPRDGWPQERAWAMASGADWVLDGIRVFDSVAGAIADLNTVFATTARPRETRQPVRTPREAARVLYDDRASGLGVGLLFGGVFQCDFECSLASPSVEAVLHDVFGGIGYLCGVVGVLLVGLAWRNRPDRRALYRLSLLCGVPAAMAVWLIHPAFEWYGAAQRLLELALAIWTVGVALEIRRIQAAKRPPRAA